MIQSSDRERQSVKRLKRKLNDISQNSVRFLGIVEWVEGQCGESVAVFFYFLFLFPFSKATVGRGCPTAKPVVLGLSIVE